MCSPARQRWELQSSLMLSRGAATRNGHQLAGSALNGRTKLIDVAIQIQYFVVAEPRGIDVRRKAVSQTIEAKKRWISIDCERRAACSSMPFPSTAAALPASRVFKSLQVLERYLAVLDETGDEMERRSAEQIEEIANQPLLMFVPVDGSRKHLRVADFLDLAQRTFFLEPGDERLHGRIRNALCRRQALKNFADGTGSELPDLLEDSCFGFGKPRRFLVSHSCR